MVMHLSRCSYFSYTTHLSQPQTGPLTLWCRCLVFITDLCTGLKLDPHMTTILLVLLNYNSGHRPSWPAHPFSHILLPAVLKFHIPPNRPSSSTLAFFAFHNPCNFQLHPPKLFYVHHIANTSTSQVGSIQRPTQTKHLIPNLC